MYKRDNSVSSNLNNYTTESFYEALTVEESESDDTNFITLYAVDDPDLQISFLLIFIK